MIKKCLICNKSFKTKLYQIKKGNGKFCSKKCYGIWWSKNIKGEKHPNWKGDRVRRLCLICNKKFYVSPTRLKEKGGRFCSLKCFGEWHSENYKKEKCYGWKGGITPITQQIRHSKKYKKWRQNVFIRDNFTCQRCKQIGDELNAHHKKPFHKFIEEIKINLPLANLYKEAMAYTPLWDLENGITLCKKCHNKIKGKKQKM